MLRELEREKRILQKTYHDRMDVYRKKLSKNAETGESIFSDVLIYGNARCSFCRTDASAPNTGTIVDNQEEKNVIFADPDLRMQNNDRVVIRTESGQIYDGTSGSTYVIASHGETEIKIEKVV